MENEVILEGFLKKWTGYLTGWRERYFILRENGTLEYADRNHGKDKGMIQLKIAEIKLTPKDPLRITIHTGVKDINIRAGSIIDKYRWVSALREAAYGENQEQSDMSNMRNSQPNKRPTSINSTNRMQSFSQVRDAHIEGGFKRIHEYENQILAILAFLAKKTFAKDVKEQVNHMDGLFKEMTKAIHDWKDAIANENERVERMKEKLDGYFDSLDNVRVNVDDGSKVEGGGSDEVRQRELRRGQGTTKSIFANGESLAEFSKEEQHVNTGIGSSVQQSEKFLTFLETTERKEEMPKKQLFVVPDENEEMSPIEKKGRNGVHERREEEENKNGDKRMEKPKIVVFQSPQKEKNGESSDNGKMESPEMLSVSRGKKESSAEIKEEEKKAEGFLMKSERSRHTKFNETTEDEEQFYSIVNPRNISKLARTLHERTIEGGTIYKTVGGEEEDDMQSFTGEDEIKFQNMKDAADLQVLNYLGPKDTGDEINLKSAEPKPMIQKILNENEAFKDLDIPFATRRFDLPIEIPENLMQQSWSYTGVNTMEVPISYYEPLSLLQKLCEQFEYSDLLDQADELDDSLLRMAHVIAFVISGYHTTSRRLTKPFDPLLGETYEFSSEADNFKYVSEQISLEPPITAFYGSSNHFECNSTMNIKTEFLGKCIEVKLEGKNEIRLKKSKDVYMFTRPITSLDHIMTGKYCISNYGEMRFKNLVTQENATVSLIKRSWDDKGINRLEGYIKDDKAQFVYKVTGKWDEEISIENLKTKEVQQIWKRKILDNSEKNFGFTHLALQLNYLHKNLLNELPLTDSRWRPDVRALENGNYELASEEKKRLKDKEIKFMKAVKEGKKEHKPKWFIEEKSQEGDAKSFVFNEEYFTQKLEEENMVDLYGQLN